MPNSMNLTRYLSFEISRHCDRAQEHCSRCPIIHAERYQFSPTSISLTDQVVVAFYLWCKTLNFRGIVNWNGYGEPSLVWPRIQKLIAEIRAHDPAQPMQIITNNPAFQFPGVDIVTRSYYDGTANALDNRMAAIRGEGKPYAQMPPIGRCIRGMGWEILIDFHGNWLLCCNDWRCEESIGNIFLEDWSGLYMKWKAKTRLIEWNNQQEYDRLPRLCRSCMEVNAGSGMIMNCWV